MSQIMYLLTSALLLKVNFRGKIWTWSTKKKLIILPKPAHIFRAIFDLSNKIALLVLRRMYALYVKKKKKTKTEIVSKE